MTSRISRLTCTSCGTDQRVKVGGGRDFASWPTLEEPKPTFDFEGVPTERLAEFMRAVFGEYKDDE
jgi:hypothetical protein